jgi:CHASE3 domain sensor protein
MISYRITGTAVFLVGAVSCYVIHDNYVAYMKEIQRYTIDYQECEQHLDTAILEINRYSAVEQETIRLREKLEFANKRLKDVEDRNQELERRLVNGK